MAHNAEVDDNNRTGVATYVVEGVVAIILLVIGGAVVYQSEKLGASWTSNGPGSGYFPFYIGLILCISGAVILFQDVFGKHKNTDVFIDHDQLKRVISVLAPIGLYILAVKWLGLYIASTLYIAGFMIWLGKYSWFKGLLVGLAVNILFFLSFEVWFQVPLYKGEWDLLSFLGY